MNGRKAFEGQMTLLEKKIGSANIDEVYKVYAITTEFLVLNGHGCAELNAIHHKFNNKVAFRIVRSID